MNIIAAENNSTVAPREYFISLSLLELIFRQHEFRLGCPGLYTAISKSLVRRGRVPGDRNTLGNRPGRRQGKHQTLRGMMRDMPCHLVMFLMDVSVQDRDVLVRHEEVYGLGPIAGPPVPIWIEIEERAMGQNNDPGIDVQFFQFTAQPQQLSIPDARRWIRDIVQGDEMHTFVVESISGISETFLECLAVVQAGIMLSCQEFDILHLEPAYDVGRFSHAFSSFLGIVRGMSYISRENDEIWRCLHAVDRRDRFFQSSGRIRVYGRSAKPPVRV